LGMHQIVRETLVSEAHVLLKDIRGMRKHFNCG
jgi:hypothetical protein